MKKQSSVTPEAVIQFWFHTLTPQDWYAGGEALDQRCRDQFSAAWNDLQAGDLEHWRSQRPSTLAYLILSDQLPRNMFRDTDQAFASDPHARAVAKAALTAGWDMKVDETIRQFFYMPLMHSESSEDQHRCVRLVQTRLPNVGVNTLLHARAHREVIRRFGRFPTRNAALRRINSAAEQAYLTEGGYGAIVKALDKGAL